MIITTLDRMVLGAFFRSYMIVWTSLISLYIVIDLFTHLDAVANRPGGFPAVVNYVVHYYGNRIPQVFDLMAEPIALLAATFTASWMQRNNELLPLLSAGVPTRRVIRPVILGAAFVVALAPLNTEFVIPEVADELMRNRDDPEGAKGQLPMGAYDRSRIHIEGTAAYRKDRRVERFCATFPETSPGGMIHLTAEDAVYVLDAGGPLTGGWMLTGTVPETFADPPPLHLTPLGPGRAFLKTESADFDTVARGQTWAVFASTGRLREMLASAEPKRQVKLAVMFHTRITRPVIGLLLVMLGVAVILWNPHRHIALSAGLCLGIGVGYYGLVFGCAALGNADLLSPPLAAWLPVLFYGPAALVSFDAIHT